MTKMAKTKTFPFTEHGKTWGTIHTQTGLVVTGERLPHLHKSPLRLGDRTFPVGTKFRFFGGHHTSAGFELLDFSEHEPLEYCGTMLDIPFESVDGPPGPKLSDNDLVCFRTETKPGELGEFFAWWQFKDGGSFFYGNASNAARMIEHDRTTVWGEEIPPIDPVLKKKRQQPEKAKPEPSPAGLIAQVKVDAEVLAKAWLKIEPLTPGNDRVKITVTAKNEGFEVALYPKGWQVISTFAGIGGMMGSCMSSGTLTKLLKAFTKDGAREVYGWPVKTERWTEQPPTIDVEPELFPTTAPEPAVVLGECVNCWKVTRLTEERPCTCGCNVFVKILPGSPLYAVMEARATD